MKYKQGNTTVWSDGEKLVIKNKSGRQHIKNNIDSLFGEGEYDKIYKVKYYENSTPSKTNKYAKHIEICSGYIPPAVKLDIQKESLPGQSDTLLEEYFDD